MPKKKKATPKEKLAAFLEEQKQVLEAKTNLNPDEALSTLEDHIEDLEEDDPSETLKELAAKLKLPASPTIKETFQAFLREQEKRLKPSTYADIEAAIGLLQDYIDGYCHDCLSDDERELFSLLADQGEEPEMSELVGPDRIVENYTSFLNYFMIRKVICDAQLKKAAGTATKKLALWLHKQGHISQEAADEAAEIGEAAARYLPKAEKAVQLLYELSEYTPVRAHDLEDEDYHDFSEFTITKIQRGKLWLEGLGGEKVGPVEVPPKLTNKLEKDWGITCSLGRYRGKWYFLETANVYPN